MPIKKKTKVTWSVPNMEIGERKRKLLQLKVVNPYPNHPLGLLQLVFSFTAIWIRQTTRELSMTTRQMRLALAIIVPFLMVYGTAFTITGLFQGLGMKLSLIVPYYTQFPEFFWGLFIIGSLLMLAAFYGLFGIYGRRHRSTQAFALISYIYGHASLTITMSWLLMRKMINMRWITFDSDQDVSDERYKPTVNQANIELAHFNFEPDNFLGWIIHTVFVISLLLTATGVLTGILLCRENLRKGFSGL